MSRKKYTPNKFTRTVPPSGGQTFVDPDGVEMTVSADVGNTVLFTIADEKNKNVMCFQIPSLDIVPIFIAMVRETGLSTNELIHAARAKGLVR